MRFACGLAFALVVSACSSEPSPIVTNTGSTDCTTTAGVIKAVFEPKCSGGGCHSPGTGENAPANDLDLVSPGVDSRVVGVAAQGCGGQTLVVPANPDSSFLYRKATDAKPACGARMPAGAPALTASELNCMRTWIDGLKATAPTDAGVDTGGAGADASVSCTAPLASCGGKCVDTTSDVANCGGCGKPCATGQVCSAGACSSSCPTGTTNCSGACVDTKSNASHCGGCGKACDAGSTCSGGTCSCGATASFSKDVQPIFTASCATIGCHTGAMPRGSLNLAAGKSYAELVNVASSSCSSRQLVVPGDNSKSYLMNKLTGVGMCSGTQMPKAGSSLPAAQLAKISAWICNGAKND